MPSIVRNFASLLFFLPLTLNNTSALGQNPSKTTSTQPPQKTDTPAPNSPRRLPRVVTDIGQFHLDRNPVPNKQNQIGAGSRGSSQALNLCAPGSGVAYSTRPLFEWHASDGNAAKVTFSLLSDAGDVLYENDIVGSSFEYPADAPALLPGESYSWKVSGSEMNRLPGSIAIQVQDKPDREALLSKLAADGPVPDPLAHAQVFLKSGVWYDTIATLRTAIKKYPDRKDLRDQLVQLYQQVVPACAAP